MICGECQLPIVKDRYLFADFPCGHEAFYCSTDCEEDGIPDHASDCRECNEGDSQYVIVHTRDRKSE